GLKLLGQTEVALVFDLGPIRLRVAIVDRVRAARHTVLGWEVPDVDAVVAELAHHGVALERFAQLQQDAHGIWTAPGG
ncbi:MAG: VOC family protein, partial [Gemmatimonadetes bacterium]|nr:VOC family protein [Gemmatimonadota bacterium]NIQ53908.1 VOC family protein [Gemmatimonadota bacterium]NIU74084.1 VOC family protein [Gammaproteobacteria bacterium]NIX44146.1 VOC family protein [Gemmatimonadota bacterium]NIY08370.1 VOC family protein [Gemmatimonadota bacterium]